MTRPLSIDATIRTYVKKLEADLAEARAKNAELHSWADTMLRKIEDLEAQIAAKA